MGFVTLFSASARREEAAGLIESYFRVLQQHGMFEGDAAKTARLIVAVACAQAPNLTVRRYQQFVLPAACLTVLLLETEEPPAMRELYAMALRGMLQAAQTSRKPYSFAERKYLELAEQTYLRYRTEHPSPAMHTPSERAIAPEASADRVRDMDALIQRMSSGKRA